MGQNGHAKDHDVQSLLAEFAGKPDLAAQFRVSPRTIDRWVRMRLLPAPVRMGRTSLFHVPTVKRHLEHLSATTSDRCPRVRPKC